MHWRRKPPTWSAGEWKEHYEPSLHESIFGRPARLSPEDASQWAKRLAEWYLYGWKRRSAAATPAFTNPSAAMPLGISVNEHARMQFFNEHMYKFHLYWPRIAISTSARSALMILKCMHASTLKVSMMRVLH